ncbi:MAG: bacteriohopanetetrol glucosamine biosynthesis glycosyltransferase HpnI [Deltaproteobacteria bacterium]|nr:MAG: bacteriohopanetetrol glucosamine biosynthesis glycosyltransferase HpnI [Deltaproteobacteria bacterium]
MTWQYILLIPVIIGSVFCLVTTICMAFFITRKQNSFEPKKSRDYLPFVSLIKPVYGLEKDLYVNLATACKQDYPDYEVIYGVQRRDDPALRILEKIQREHPQTDVQIVIDENAVGPNGKVSNIYNISQRAKGDVFVISDSDMFLRPDYLRTIVAPLVDEKVGISCTLYKAWKPKNTVEALELLSFNVDFIPSIVFAVVTNTSIACPGQTHAICRRVLNKIGGLAPLSHYLVEDYELGRRVVEAGYRIRFVPYVVDMGVELKTFQDWWRHQVYWDQNTRSANPSGFFFTFLIRALPFALLYALLGGPYGWAVIVATTSVRIVTAVANSTFLGDKDGAKNFWLLPFRDILAVFVWLASFLKRQTYWRDKTFVLEKGKLTEVK